MVSKIASRTACCSTGFERSIHPARSRSALSKRIRPSAGGASPSQSFSLGIDFGTSGARGIVIDEDKQVVATARADYAEDTKLDWAAEWERALFHLVDNLPADVRSRVQSLAFDGTSSTALLVDRTTGEVLAPPKLYNEAQGDAAVQSARSIAPPAHTASASTSTLSKLLAWDLEGTWQQAEAEGRTPALLHQADWLAALLHGQRDVTDWNNALKLGFDPGNLEYPAWLTSQAIAKLLPPRVCAPGEPVAALTQQAAQRTGLPADCTVCAGTTDSIAAFLAAGVSSEGQAVTSLGSSLAVKLLSNTRVDDAAFGVYSHRLGDTWLVGGASNTGGAVLKRFFSDAQLSQLTQQIDPSTSSGLDYYPLLSPGERFPVNDPALQPRMEPRPESDARFLHGLLDGIANVEARAYQQLREMGASSLTQVFTAGGGARNEKWTQIRAAKLGVRVINSPQGEAAYGAALLAHQGLARRNE